MFGLGAGEIAVIGFLALVLIGPKKLPELARSLGRGLREFQKAKDDIMTDINNEPPLLKDINNELPLLKDKNDEKKDPPV